MDPSVAHRFLRQLDSSPGLFSGLFLQVPIFSLPFRFTSQFKLIRLLVHWQNFPTQVRYDSVFPPVPNPKRSQTHLSHSETNSTGWVWLPPFSADNSGFESQNQNIWVIGESGCFRPRVWRRERLVWFRSQNINFNFNSFRSTQHNNPLCLYCTSLFEMVWIVRSVRLTQLQAAHNDYSQFSAAADSEALYKSMKGFGTDDESLINIITGRPREYLIHKVKPVYHGNYKKTLDDDIKGDTRFEII